MVTVIFENSILRKCSELSCQNMGKCVHILMFEVENQLSAVLPVRISKL